MKRQPWFTATLFATVASLLALPNGAIAHQIIETSGSVSVKKSNWADAMMMGVGTQLQAGDLLTPSGGATIKVLCDNLTVWNVPNGDTSDVASGCEDLPDLAMDLEYHQGGTNDAIPYVITPRNTLLMSNEFNISWNGVRNATSYLVTIEGEDGFTWSQEVEDTQVLYSGEEPLEAGVFYLVSVVADTDVSSVEDQGAKLGFTLVVDNLIEGVETRKTAIENTDLSDEGKAIATAILYSLNNLNADAIASLETLVADGTQTALVYQMLGDLYVKTGLNSLAEASYSQAIVLASDSEDLEVLTNAQAGLAGVNILLGNHFHAGKLTQQAETGYHLLGNHHHAMTLEDNVMGLMNHQQNHSMASRTVRGGNVNPFDDAIAPLGCCGTSGGKP
jgi:hypothetical protein